MPAVRHTVEQRLFFVQLCISYESDGNVAEYFGASFQDNHLQVKKMYTT
jgi:uncharacterized protein CbrC (UPF0167 family)